MNTVLEVSTLMVRQVHVSKAMLASYQEYWVQLAPNPQIVKCLSTICTCFTCARAVAVVVATLQEVPFVYFHLVLISFTWQYEQYIALYQPDVYICWKITLILGP
jgi:hypothetical protein